MYESTGIATRVERGHHFDQGLALLAGRFHGLAGRRFVVLYAYQAGFGTQ